MSEGLLLFWEGAGGDVVLNKVSVRLLAAPRAQPQSSHSAAACWNSHPEDLRPRTAPAASPKRLRAAPEPPRELHPPAAGPGISIATPRGGGDSPSAASLAGLAPSPCRQMERLPASQPARRTDRQTDGQPTLPTPPAPNPPAQSLWVPQPLTAHPAGNRSSGLPSSYVPPGNQQISAPGHPQKPHGHPQKP